MGATDMEASELVLALAEAKLEEARVVEAKGSTVGARALMVLSRT